MDRQQRTQYILDQYHVADQACIGTGMEASVYALDTARVLKIYHALATQTHLTHLQTWYARLDATHIPFQLPTIYTVSQEHGLLYTIEKRIPGSSLATVLPTQIQTGLATMLDRYFAGLTYLANIRIAGPITQYKLIDPTHMSIVTTGDWHHFLRQAVTQQTQQLARFFQQDVDDYSHKLAQLLHRLSEPYTGDITLIHGDYFPGNILVNDTMAITGVIDFGLFTMVGDHLFDIATGSAFFDMYDTYTSGTRHQLFDRAVEYYGEGIRDKLYLYLLIYSILSANVYAEDCSDGHYAWCVHNLNTDKYWKGIA